MTFPIWPQMDGLGEQLQQRRTIRPTRPIARPPLLIVLPSRRSVHLGAKRPTLPVSQRPILIDLVAKVSMTPRSTC